MKYKYIPLFFVIFSCGGGGSSSALIPNIEPPTNSYQAISCQNYDGPTDKIIWLDDFTDIDYADNWTAIIGNGHIIWGSDLQHILLMVLLELGM